jgi:hypothetical protein
LVELGILGKRQRVERSTDDNKLVKKRARMMKETEEALE